MKGLNNSGMPFWFKLAMYYILKYLFLLSCISLLGCKTMKRALQGATPYEKYQLSLDKAGLKEAPMVTAWHEAGKAVFSDSIIVPLPFSESGFFQAGQPEARSYRCSIKEGQVLSVKVLIKTIRGGRIFLDLFRNKEGQWRHIVSADTSLVVEYEPERDEELLMRLQPELLINAYFTISISHTPILINPVKGASNKSIGSFYGDARDGGGRKHEGVDIFAPKGTPVVAPTDGYITRVSQSRLGGKVVWMYDLRRSHSYYFAHLDSQMVSTGQKVRQGETLGTVGNTGNALTTPPHLHFGIYQRGSKDPLHFIKRMEAVLNTSVVDTVFKPQAFRVAVKRAPLHTGPNTKRSVIKHLDKDAYVKVVGYTSDWYRVTLPDRSEGYIARKLVVKAEKGKVMTVSEEAFVLHEAHDDAIPIGKVEKEGEVEVLGTYDQYSYVVTKQGLTGWLVND